MGIINSSLLARASQQAAKAKPGILKHRGKTYTLVFDPVEWIYRVYEDGFELVRFNTKSLTIAKKWTIEYIG